MASRPTQARNYDQSIRQALETDAAGREACRKLGGIVRLRATNPDLADKLLVQSRKLRGALDEGDAERIEQHGAAMGRGWALACQALSGMPATNEAVPEPAEAFLGAVGKVWPGASLWDIRAAPRS